MMINDQESIFGHGEGLRGPDSANLRRGWTTGACAAAAAKAATEGLLGVIFPDPITIDLPRGIRQPFNITAFEFGHKWARASVRKDAGDDPDVTHGALIVCEVRITEPGSGIRFIAGSGVGTVTRPGLPISVGEPAISPGPRKYIKEAIESVTERGNKPCNFDIIISVPGGEKLAQKTLNERLGIKGGISILGTTGVVIPYSCGAWIASIHRGVDVARAAGLTHIAAATGRTSETGVKDLHQLSDQAIIDMGDFAGGFLKYLSKNPLPRVTIAGGFAKIAKLARGHLDLHSKRSQIDIEYLVTSLSTLGASDEIINEAKMSSSGAEILLIAQKAKLPLANLVAVDSCKVVIQTLSSGDHASGISVDVVIFDRNGVLVGHANG